MSLNLTVTPGTVFAAEQNVNADDLNAGANPVVTIDDGSITADLIDTEDLVDEIGDALREQNYAPVGTFWETEFLAASQACAVNVKTVVHPGWWVRPTGAAVTVTPAPRSVATQTDEGGRAGMKITGATGVTDLEAGFYLPPGAAQILSGGNMTLSIYVRNRTGTSFTPSLKLYCSNSAGDEGAVTLQSTVTGSGACADSQWTRVEFDFDASAVTNFANGVLMVVYIDSGSGIMDSGSDYVILADAQIDKGVLAATGHKPQPPPVDLIPAGLSLPWLGAYNDVPPGFLLEDGTAVSRVKYPRLFRRLSTTYGVGDGSTTFNLPDSRGRTKVGAEIAGSSQSRTEVSVAATGTSGEYWLTVTTTNLRYGMGAYATGIPDGAYITDLTGTQAKLSAALTGNISGTVRFGKLGAGADPETLGAAGTGIVNGARRINIVQKGCSTATNTTLTVKTLYGLACGMLVDCSGVPAGTTIACFLSPTTVRLSAATTATASALTATFRVDAPDSEQEETYQNLLVNPTILCRFSAANDQNLQTGAVSEDINWLIHPGWSVTGEAGAAIAAGTYVNTVDSNLHDFSLSAAAANAGAASYELTFSGGSLSTVAQTPTALPALVCNWIVKT